MSQALKTYSKGAPFYNVWPARFRDGFHISTIAVYQDFAISSELLTIRSAVHELPERRSRESEEKTAG